jgi:sulfocyanin
MRLLKNVMMPGMRGLLLTSALLLGAATTQAQSPSGAKIDPAWLRADAASKTAEFKLVGGMTELNGGMNFNGFSRGGLVVTVPQGWHVVLHFKNQDPNLPHSVEVIPEGAAVPSGPVPPAFDDATTGRLDQGFSAGQGADVRFVAKKPGAYLIFCAVPGHGAAGMWIRLVVSPADKPSLATAPER